MQTDGSLGCLLAFLKAPKPEGRKEHSWNRSMHLRGTEETLAIGMEEQPAL